MRLPAYTLRLRAIVWLPVGANHDPGRIVTIRRSIRPSWYAGISTCLPVPRRKAASRTICCTPGLVSWIGRWWRNCASTALR
jgi:hypothetical protein